MQRTPNALPLVTAPSPRLFLAVWLRVDTQALEDGNAKHLMPVNPDKVRKGLIPLRDVPYMQRGGSWDNTDLKGKKGWQLTGFGMKAFNDGQAKEMKLNQVSVLFSSSSLVK